MIRFREFRRFVFFFIMTFSLGYKWRGKEDHFVFPFAKTVYLCPTKQLNIYHDEIWLPNAYRLDI